MRKSQKETSCRNKEVVDDVWRCTGSGRGGEEGGGDGSSYQIVRKFVVVAWFCVCV